MVTDLIREWGGWVAGVGFVTGMVVWCGVIVWNVWTGPDDWPFW